MPELQIDPALQKLLDFAKEIILWGVRWYVAYPISYRQLEEMRQERGVAVDHSTLNLWVVKYAPEIEKQFRLRKRVGGKSWRMDETYIRVKGEWKYLYRTVNKEGQIYNMHETPKYLIPKYIHGN